MGDDFIFDDDNKSKGIIKWVLIVVAVVLGLSGILAVLITTSVMDDIGNCREISEYTGISIERCDNRFEQIIFVVGDTANTPNPNIDEKKGKIISSMYDIEKHGAKGLSYISVSKPDDAPQAFAINKKGADKIAQRVVEKINTSSASVDGADYLEAIRNAAYHAKNKEDTLIYVIGSGLSDAGLLNFAEKNLLVEYSTDEIRKAVSSMIDERDELSGLTIFWEGLGDTVSPQEPLSVILKKKERKIYEAVLKEMGLDQEDFIVLEDSGENRINDRVTTTVKTALTESVTIDLDDSELPFNPGQATFKNQGVAETTIKDLTNKYKNSSFSIKPFMSRGMCDWGVDTNLLHDRAEITKNLFINIGHISAVDIETETGEIGDANECPNGPGHYPVDETEAVKNRKVRISVVRK